MTHRALGGGRGNYCPTMPVESSAVYNLSKVAVTMNIADSGQTHYIMLLANL